VIKENWLLNPPVAARSKIRQAQEFLAVNSTELMLLGIVVIALVISYIYSYLLYHTIVELISIVVAFTVFLLAWKSQRFLDNGYLLFIGVAHLFIGGIDLIHTLAYQGMQIFPTESANLPTQLWIAARYLQAASWVMAPIFLNCRIKSQLLVLGFSLVAFLLMMSIFYWDIFPASYIDGVGLTPFKIYSEYFISVLLLVAAGLLFANRREFDQGVLRWLSLSILAGILSELAFTEYIHVYGFFNMVGHVFKLAAFYFIYKAIIETGFEKPYDLLFRKLKQSEEALRSSESRLRRLFDSDVIGVIIADRYGGISEANHAFQKLVGYSPGEFAGGLVRWKDLTPDEYHDKDEKGIIEALNSNQGSCTPYEKEYIHKDGRRVPVLIGYALLEGSQTEFICFVLDLSEGKEAQKALKRIEWLLTKSLRQIPSSGEENHKISYENIRGISKGQVLLETVGDEVLKDVISDFLNLLETSAAVIEKNGDFVLWTFSSGWCQTLNSASRKLYDTPGNQEAAASGKWLCYESCWNNAAKISIETKQPVDTSCFGCINIYAVPVIADGEVIGSLSVGYGDPPKEPETLKQVASRFQIPVEELEKAALAYESRPLYMIELAKNRLNVSARLIGSIVERKQAEKRVQVYAAQLEHTNQELKDFAFIASHDLQEPLRKIHAFGERLFNQYGDEMDEEGRFFLERMTDASERMQQMIRDLLAYSRITTQAKPFEKVDLDAVLEEVISDLEVRIESTNGTVEVQQLPVVEADPLQMRQLLLNLISNALKFHQNGIPPHVSITSEVFDDNKPGGAPWVRIEVKDNGIGFEVKHLERIFQPFQRLVGKTEYEGSGIGMAICRKIVLRHQGQITAVSSPGEGTTFIVTLPVNQPGVK
jgi:PAS domain S-box-containing protein